MATTGLEFRLLMPDFHKPTPPSMSELRLVLLGGNWSERKSVGNFILGCDGFTTSSDIFKKFSAELEEKQISVINSPDVSFHTAEELTAFIRKCSAVSDPGPHVFLLVVQPESFTEYEKDKIYRILQAFSDRSFDHSLVLILKSRQEGSVINSPLKDLIRKCSYRYLKMEETEREQLLIRFGQIEKENNEEHVRHEDLTNTLSTGSFAAVDQTNVTSPLKRSHSSELIPPSLSEPELRVVLLGGNWSQRNTVRNFILGGKDFTTKPNSFIKITGTVEDRKVSVINTPDLQFLTIKEMTEFIRDCALASDPGPHVFLLVLQPENFTEKEKNRIYKVLYHFNDESFDHSLIMILNPKQKGSGLMEKRMKNPLLKELIRECNYRYLHQMMVEPSELLTRFKQIVKENNGEHVSFDEFEEEESQDVSVHDGEVEDPSQTTELIPQQLPKDDNSFRIVLLGDNEEKKTELVNQVILIPELVIQKLPSQCVANCGKWKGKPVTMVTFPNPFSLTEIKMRAELESCRSLCHPGPNVLLLLVNPSEFYKEQRSKLNSVLKLFGRDAFKRSVVVITHDDGLIYQSTENLIEACEERRYEMFTAQHGEHEELMNKVGDIVKKNQKDTSDLLGAKGKSFSEDTPVNHHAECLRMVLIGKTGSGKSSSGNTILGRKAFKSAISPQSVTRTCQKAGSEVDGRHVVVVDTPGLFDTNLTSDQVNEELKSCISLVAPGPHVFLLVLPIGRFTKGEDTETLRQIEEVLGHNYKSFTVVLFTRGDTLENDEIPIADYIEGECDEACKKLIRDCGGRIHVFNNYEINNRSQVTELIEMIDIMVEQNKGTCYTREMLCGVNI